MIVYGWHCPHGARPQSWLQKVPYTAPPGRAVIEALHENVRRQARHGAQRGHHAGFSSDRACCAELESLQASSTRLLDITRRIGAETWPFQTTPGRRRTRRVNSSPPHPHRKPQAPV